MHRPDRKRNLGPTRKKAIKLVFNTEELDVIRGKGEDMKYVVEHLEELSEDEYTQAEIEAFDKQQKIQWSKEELAWDEGAEKKQKEIALNLLNKGIAIKIISESTGLTEKEIRALQEKKR